MKNLIIKYNRKDFFGNRTYTEDTKSNFTKADLAKAFLFISKNHDAAIQIDDMVIFWESIADHDQKMVSVRIYNNRSYTEGKFPFEEVKKNFYKKFKNIKQAA